MQMNPIELLRLADIAEGAVMTLCEAIEANARQKASAKEDHQSAWDDVLDERRRRIEIYGWTPGKNDALRLGELASAAACYCHPEPCMDETKGVPFSWPFHRKMWEPTDRRSDLVKAAALILAEIERLDRAAADLERSGAMVP